MRIAIALAAAALAACSAPPKTPRAAPPSAAPPPKATSYHATVRWTSDGVPHVTGDDWGSVGFGQGWALASLHLCEVEDQVVRIRSERARFFGPGADGQNLDSDFFHLHLGFVARAPRAIAALSPEARAMAHGFAAGFDRWLALHADAAPAACRGAPWLRPITDLDVAAMALAIATTASSRAFEPLIANAAPRDAKAARATLPERDVLASNGWAVGADRTRSGGGLLLANPHFPWAGDLTFYESQLTIPGQLDVYGAALVGTPGIDIGFNAHVAWTHTFSSSTHTVIYRVPLAKDAPLRIAVGDTPEPIVPATYTVKSKQADGSLEDVTRTLYRTRWGPMLDSAELPWDRAQGFAFTLDDVALDDTLALDMYLAFARAESVGDVDQALRSSHTPFLNTLAADARGDALYVDASRVPALSDDALTAWTLGRRVMPAVQRAWDKGVVVLDASMPVFALAGDAHGALPIDARTPRLQRRDFVINANGPFAWTHPGVEMPAASPLYGDAREPSPRTLANWALLAGDAKLDRDQAAALLFSNRSFTAEAIGDDVAAACTHASEEHPRRAGGGGPAGSAGGAGVFPRGIDAACKAFAAWDRRFGVDARGAALFRDFTQAITRDGRIPWAHPYDPADPTTPRGLALPAKTIRDALAAAAAKLGRDAGAPLGALQTAATGAGRVGVPGGEQQDGVANVVMWSPALDHTLLPRDDGGGARYPVDFGSSFVLAVDLAKDGPHANVLLTYGNSGDPASPHYRDQLDRFAKGAMRTALFTPAEVAADQRAHPDLPTDDLRYTEPAP